MLIGRVKPTGSLEVLVLYRKRASSEGDNGKMALWRAFDKRLGGGRPRGGRGSYGN